MEEMSVYDLASRMDEIWCDLTDICNSLDLLGTELEAEGYQSAESFEIWSAVAFVKRFPLFFSTYQILCKHLNNVTDDLKQTIKKAMEKDTSVAC